MTIRAEDVLFASLTDIDALERLTAYGYDPDITPTEAFRPMVAWAIDYYFDSGRKQAPSREMLLSVWGKVLEDEDVELIDEDVEIDTIESTLDHLVDLAAQREWQDYVKVASTDMANAAPTMKAATITRVANELFEITSRLQDRSNRVDGVIGFTNSLDAYQVRQEMGHATLGMTTGWAEVDEWTFGIHPGELAVVAAGPKVGKSYFLCRVGIHDWLTSERRVALATLENTVQMTMDRIVCLHLGISPRAWQRGTCTPEQVQMVEWFIKDELPKHGERLHVFMPTRGQRTPQRLVREAHLWGADSLLVDQMTHVEHPLPGRKPRHELFNENIHEFADLAKEGREPISIMVAHQINRSGIEAARKQDYLMMEHMAESAGIERAVDWAFGLWQNDDERAARLARLQIMAGRREDTTNWRIHWNPESSQQHVIGRCTPDGGPVAA